MLTSKSVETERELYVSPRISKFRIRHKGNNFAVSKNMDFFNIIGQQRTLDTMPDRQLRTLILWVYSQNHDLPDWKPDS